MSCPTCDGTKHVCPICYQSELFCDCGRLEIDAFEAENSYRFDHCPDCGDDEGADYEYNSYDPEDE